MFDSSSTQWLPGFEPDALPPAALSTTPPPPRKLLVEETQAYVAKIAHDAWPAMPDNMWDRTFSPLERAQLNLTALETAANVAEGHTPSLDQRKALNLFTGWGALSYLFKPNLSAAYQGIRDALGNLVGQEGIESAREATTTSFFTPPAIVRAMWKGLETMGFKGGKILDPSAGHGMFLANMPTHIAKVSQVTAIEPDAPTASVLKALYGANGVNVAQTTFEGMDLPEDHFDLVVTNVPFGDFGVAERRSVPFRDFLVHDYFLARAMEVVRPGGIVAIITSAGSMDKLSVKVRKYLSTKARLLDANRLPVEAFQEFAGTEPTTDVLLFQRLDGHRVQENAGEWVGVGGLEQSHSAVGSIEAHLPAHEKLRINSWYVNTPDKILGKWSTNFNQYGRPANLCKASGVDYLSQFERNMSRLPAHTYVPGVTRRPKAAKVAVSLSTELFPGSFVMDANDNICVVETKTSASCVDASLNGKAKERIRGMIAIRDKVRKLVQVQSKSEDDTRPMLLRSELNALYGAFTKKWGYLTSTANSRAFSQDPSMPLLRSLENIGDDGTVTKADIFSRRTVNARTQITQCDSSEKALMASLALYGKVDPDWIGQLLGRSATDAIDELAEAGRIFLNPVTMEWETADEYLSGNVKTKLLRAELAGNQFEANAAALRNVVPEDLLPSQINARLGSTWIPIVVYEQFIADVLQPFHPIKVACERITGTWSLTGDYGTSFPASINNAYGVHPVLSPLALVEKAMNQEVPTVTDPDPFDPKKRVVNQQRTVEAREKQSLLDEKFVQWLWSDGERSAQLSRSYNDTFNCLVNRRYDGSHLDLTGFSSRFNLHVHQKDAIWRVVSSKRPTLLAHPVGAGKTLEMICSGMELKRLGIATKPLYVVPNHMLEQFSLDFLKAYPGANILVASKKDFAGANRRQFLARAAMGDWDGVIMTHASFERIKMSDRVIKEFIAERLAELEAAADMAGADGTQRRTVKQIERQKKQWKARLAKLTNAKGDTKDCLSFEQVGFDWLMVDEAHYFKNLYRFSKMTRVAGLPNSNSERAFDMFVKCREVAKAHNGQGGITFATGTPVANSMGELYTMQMFLQPEDLARKGIESFDAWAANFGEVVTALEIAPDGSGYRMNRRFSKFVNIPELMQLFREVADIKDRDSLNLPIPACERDVLAAKPSEQLKELVQSLVERSEAIRNGAVDPKDDNMLSVTNDGRNAALDMRLLDQWADDDPGSKLNLCVAKVLDIYRETQADRSAQVIFSDLGTPGRTGRFSVYEDIKRKLVFQGVPEADIAFAHDANTDVAKEALANRVREGKVRVVIGSTQKLGVGTNIQDKLVALHHLDAPWRPADIEQREGRILRQGNGNTHVRIFRYVTEGSFDAYLWQTLETKSRFIGQIMVDDNSVRTAEDLELAALSYAEVKALASGNPLVVEKAGVDAQVAKLAVLRSAHAETINRSRHELATLPERIKSMTRRKAGVEKDIASRKAIGQLTLHTNTGAITDSKTMGAFIQKVIMQNVYRGGSDVRVGTIGGFIVSVSKGWTKDYFLTIDGELSYQIGFNGGAVAAANALTRVFDDIEPELANIEHRIAFNTRRIEELRFEVNKKFDKEDQFNELVARQVEIDASLGIADGVKMEAAAA